MVDFADPSWISWRFSIKLSVKCEARTSWTSSIWIFNQFFFLLYIYSFLDETWPPVSFKLIFLMRFSFFLNLFMWCYRKREVNLKVLKVPEIEQKVWTMFAFRWYLDLNVNLVFFGFTLQRAFIDLRNSQNVCSIINVPPHPSSGEYFVYLTMVCGAYAYFSLLLLFYLHRDEMQSFNQTPQSLL